MNNFFHILSSEDIEHQAET